MSALQDLLLTVVLDSKTVQSRNFNSSVNGGLWC